jgi:hypothetical protein
MDQWYNASTQTLYERMSDGVDFFWRTLYSPNLVVDAPSSGLIYGRYNNFWVPEPIQADAPQDGAQYARFMGGWQQVAAGFSDAPLNNIRYGRYNGVWQADAIQTDAPSNTNSYARKGGTWTALAPIIPDAPQSHQLYSRIDSNWMLTPIQTDAPNDFSFYARNNNQWVALPPFGISDAPTDGTLYGRQNGVWSVAYSASNPANYQNLAQNDARYFKLTGGTVSGGTVFTAGIILADPNRLSIGGGVVGQVLAKSGATTIAWAPPGTPEAPQDGIAYARQNGIWVPTASGAGVPEAPRDGTTYVRIDATWSNIVHSDITDWDVTLDTLLAPYALVTSVPPGSIVFPLMDGTNAIGTAGSWARADHVHPTDTSRYSVSNPANYQTLAQVTAALTPYALITSVPVASNAVPFMNGVGAAGSAAAFSRGDHTHPADTSRLAVAGGTMTGLLTLVSDPAANLQAATKQYVDSTSANANIDCGTF